MNFLKFKIHDIVKIKDVGSIYPTYYHMAEKLGATNWESGRLGNKDVIGKSAEILNINQDGDNCHILIEVTEGSRFGDQYVIGKRGIKFVESNILDDDLFEI